MKKQKAITRWARGTHSSPSSLAGKTSPIFQLRNLIAASPFRVAPEAAAALNRVVREKGIELDLVDEPRTFAELRLSRAQVRLGVPFLELLWTAANAYFTVFTEYEAAGKRKESHLHVGAIERTRDAYELYRNALLQHIGGAHVGWLSERIVPTSTPAEDTDAFAANEIFLVAVSWIIHHEIAHARLNHGESSLQPVDEENEADSSATRWICGGSTDVEHLHKRSMGMVTAVVLLLAYDLEVGRRTSPTHPPSFERLILNLDATGLDEHSMIYGFAYVLVQVHLAQAGVNVSYGEEPSLRDMCVSACLDVRRIHAAS